MKSKNRIRSIAKRQHFHMNYILKKFTTNEKLWVVDKKTGEERETDTFDNCFIAKDTWSNEIEEYLGNQDIEHKAQGQIRRVLKGDNICDQRALSEYDIFWKIRHNVKSYILPPEQIMEGWGDGMHSEHDKIAEWCNINGKVYIRSNGTISGKDSLSQQIKNSIEDNVAQYSEGVWQVHYSPNGSFISADCYQQPIIPISPYYLLACTKRDSAIKGVITETECEVEKFNSEARKQCHSFWFYSK